MIGAPAAPDDVAALCERIPLAHYVWCGMQEGTHEAQCDCGFPERMEVVETLERLAAENARLQALAKDEYGIVARIWEIYGNPDYKTLDGKSLYDLIEADKSDLARLQATVKFQEKQYLAEHGGSWGVCKYQSDLAACRAEFAVLQKDSVSIFEWLDRKGGLGHDVHNRINTFLATWRKT